jgi:hypothetical protein
VKEEAMLIGGLEALEAWTVRVVIDYIEFHLSTSWRPIGIGSYPSCFITCICTSDVLYVFSA